MEMMKRVEDKAAFTLIELLVAMVIFSVVMAGVVLIFFKTSDYFTDQEMMVSLTQDLRAVKHLMADEVRSAGCNPKNKRRMGFEPNSVGSDTADLASRLQGRFDTDANSLSFTRDIDNGDGDEFFEPDGKADEPFETVSYYRIDTSGTPLDAGETDVNGELIAGTLVRNIGGGVAEQRMMDNVVDLQFLYYDSSNTIIDPATINNNADADEIMTVEVVVIGQPMNPDRVIEATQESRFRIRVRNAGV